jgi:hypothetical protein
VGEGVANSWPFGNALPKLHQPLCVPPPGGPSLCTMSNVITPDVTHFGGGIQKDQVGARTAKYVDYFAEDASKDGTQLTAKRLANYQDVVNSCALSSHTCVAAQPVAWGTSPRVGPLPCADVGPQASLPLLTRTHPLLRLRPGHLLLRVRLVRHHPSRGEENPHGAWV